MWWPAILERETELVSEAGTTQTQTIEIMEIVRVTVSNEPLVLIAIRDKWLAVCSIEEMIAVKESFHVPTLKRARSAAASSVSAFRKPVSGSMKFSSIQISGPR